MKRSTVAGISFASLCIGFFYYAWQKKLIIIQLPSQQIHDYRDNSAKASKKNILIYFWAHDTFKHEPSIIISSDNKADTLRYIVISWLTVLEQSGCISKHIELESVMLSASGNIAYLSFEHPIIAKHEPTFEKWMRIEGLLKTIHHAQLGVSQVYLFVHHQPMSDPHVDFSQAWPIQGFLAV